MLSLSSLFVMTTVYTLSLPHVCVQVDVMQLVDYPRFTSMAGVALSTHISSLVGPYQHVAYNGNYAAYAIYFNREFYYQDG